MQTDLNQISERERRRLTRRELLKLTPLAALGALAVPSVNENFIKRGLALGDRAAQQFFRRRQLAPTFADRDVTPFAQFPVNSYSEYDPANDLAGWKLTVEGAVARPGAYTLEQIKALPKQVQNVPHICIEGWHVIGNFGGARLGDFLHLAGADPTARFVEVACLDDYYTSYDIESCRHAQTLLCYEMYGQPLTAAHGAPLRVHMPVKLGYKAAKHIYSLRVGHVLGKDKGFWEDQGYAWHGGI